MGGLIFLFVIAVFLILPVFTYLIFWYETATSNSRTALYRESNGRPYVWVLRGLLSSMLTNAMVICLYPFGFMKKMTNPNSKNKNHGPVMVLIHGLYHNPSAWTYFRWRLGAMGYGKIYTFHYGSLGSSFWEIYDKLEAWMKRVETDAMGEDIVLVGHSLGGLLAKTYAARANGSRQCKIRRVITLAAPFKGSKMVVFGFGSLAKSLLFHGPLVRELEQLDPVTTLPGVAFYSPVDNMILPTESMIPPSGWKREKTAPLCHTALLYHRPTFDRVLHHILEGDG